MSNLELHFWKKKSRRKKSAYNDARLLGKFLSYEDRDLKKSKLFECARTEVNNTKVLAITYVYSSVNLIVMGAYIGAL